MLRLIDSLTYLGRDINLQDYQFSTPNSLNAVLDKYKMSGALVCSFTCAMLDIEYGNTMLFKALEGEKRLWPCPAVLPNGCGETGNEERYLDGLIEKGARFCCLLHASSGTSLDRRIIGSLFAALEKRRLPVALFSTATSAAATLAEAYPRLPIVLHIPNTRDRIFWPLFKQTPNLYFSMAANYSHYRGLEFCLRENGADRILFASGYPVSEPGAAVANLFYSDLKESDRRKIASENCERLMTSVKAGGKKRKVILTQSPELKTGQSGINNISSVVWERKPAPWNGIVDMHAHYGKWREFPIWGGAADDLVREMDRLGVAKILVAHQACMTPDVVWGNDQVLAAMRKYPGRIGGYACCYPVDKKLGIGEITRCIEAGMTGIKLHNANGLAYTDSRYRPVWEYADRLRLPVLLHTWGDISSYEQIFKKYRHAPILLGHSGSRNPESYVKFARKYLNLYLDLTLSAAPYGLVEYFVREAGADRILYGSDALWMSMQHQIGRVLFADISNADKINILVKNPRRILKGIRHG
ncbi:MAG: amidohydrolase [Verrucomicrobia bacterium]|nr:amidohydrolase [Verrucomicrobiota bacterium]MBU4429964.1 amidohydrolase [Verrucomicrobiota bacterium]MBU4497386.1 amidohydrolase [Verrucomicrobiota bacterium]MCG2679892.1 amidohydrolase [Kiritimatiellia bacterium]